MKTYGGVEVYMHAFLNSALDGAELSASNPGRFTSGERDFSTHWVGGWVGRRAGLDAVAKRKKSLLLPGIETQSSTLSQNQEYFVPWWFLFSLDVSKAM
jgi:hypothetical protein